MLSEYEPDAVEDEESTQTKYVPAPSCDVVAVAELRMGAESHASVVVFVQKLRTLTRGVKPLASTCADNVAGLESVTW